MQEPDNPLMYIVMRKASVLWVNQNRIFWVHLKASRLLRHSGVKKFITHAGASRAAQHMGGAVSSESELVMEVKQPAKP